MENAAQLGPYSRASRIASIDGRRREAQLMKRITGDLIAHVGGKPSATQRRLIDRVAWLSLHVELMDKRAIEKGRLSERDTRSYLAWSNSLSRALRDLGLKPASAQPQSLKDYVAAAAKRPEKSGAAR